MSSDLWTDTLGLSNFRKRVLDEKKENLNTGWEDVLWPQGMVLCGEAWDDAELVEWCKAWADYHLSGSIRDEPHRVIYSRERLHGQCLSDYCGNWGFPHVLMPLYRITGEQCYLDASVHVCRTLLEKANYVADGAISHSGQGGVMNRLWVDTLYYSSSVLAQVYRVTGEKDLADHAIHQCLEHAKYLRDSTTGCFFHDACTQTGLRTHAFWSRGNGWVVLSFADVLRHCPPDAEGYEQVLAIQRDLIVGLLRYRHACGLWRIIPEDDRSPLEISGSVMITAAILMGVKDGYLPIQLQSEAMQTVREVLSWVHPNGKLMGAQRPAGLGGWETHKRSEIGECTYATGLFMRMLAESMVGSSGQS